MLILLFKKSRSRKGILLLLAYLYVVTCPFAAKVALSRWWVKDSVQQNVTYDAAVVLLGIADLKWYARHQTGRGGEILKSLGNYQHFGDTADRILSGAWAVKTGKAKKILLSDVVIWGISETEILVDFLQSEEVSRQQYAIYGKARNTLDEAKGVKSYSEKNKVNTLLLITSANHMRRASALFAAQGLKPDLLSVSREDLSLGVNDFVPSARGLNATYGLLYEIVGYGGYWLKGGL